MCHLCLRTGVTYVSSPYNSLEGLAYGRAIPDPSLFAAFVQVFTMLQRRHQTLENNVVLPAAFEYFEAKDREALAHSMLARRADK